MESMDCARLRELLIEHVDGLLGREEAEAARIHLAACAPCAALQEEVRRDFAALDAWEDEELPSGAFDRLRARADAVAAAAAAVPVPVPAPASPAPRRWSRLAVPYAAGLATAAAAAWAILLPGAGAAPVGGAAPSAGPAPAAPAGVPSDIAPVALVARPAPRTLEFRDADAKTIRKFLLPPGVDPSQVQLVAPASLPLDAGDGVR